MARTSHTVSPSTNAQRRDAQPPTNRSRTAQATVAQCYAPRLGPIPLPPLNPHPSAHTHYPTASVPVHRGQQGHVAQGGALQLYFDTRAGAASHAGPVSSTPRSSVPPSYVPPIPAQQPQAVPKAKRYDSYPLPPTPASSPPPPAAASVPCKRRRDSASP